MPLIEIKVIEDEFSDEQRTGIIEAITDTMVSAHVGRARGGQERQLGDRRHRGRPDRRARAAAASTRTPHVTNGRPLKTPRDGGVNDREEPTMSFALARSTTGVASRTPT